MAFSLSKNLCLSVFYTAFEDRLALGYRRKRRNRRPGRTADRQTRSPVASPAIPRRFRLLRRYSNSPHPPHRQAFRSACRISFANNGLCYILFTECPSGRRSGKGRSWGRFCPRKIAVTRDTVPSSSSFSFSSSTQGILPKAALPLPSTLPGLPQLMAPANPRLTPPRFSASIPFCPRPQAAGSEPGEMAEWSKAALC